MISFLLMLKYQIRYLPFFENTELAGNPFKVWLISVLNAHITIYIICLQCSIFSLQRRSLSHKVGKIIHKVALDARIMLGCIAAYKGVITATFKVDVDFIIFRATKHNVRSSNLTPFILLVLNFLLSGDKVNRNHYS